MRQKITIPPNARSIRIELTERDGAGVDIQLGIIPPVVWVTDYRAGEDFKAHLSANASARVRLEEYELWVFLSGGEWVIELSRLMAR